MDAVKHLARRSLAFALFLRARVFFGLVFQKLRLFVNTCISAPKRFENSVSFGYCMQFLHFQRIPYISIGMSEKDWARQMWTTWVLGTSWYTASNKYVRTYVRKSEQMNERTNEWIDVTYVLARYVWRKVNLQCMAQEEKWKLMLICMALNQLPRTSNSTAHIY